MEKIRVPDLIIARWLARLKIRVSKISEIHDFIE